MRKLCARWVVYSVAAIAAVGCAQAPVITEKEASDPRGLLAQVCGPKGPGTGIRQVAGSAWMKAVSKDASGRFPAQILAVAPDQLTLEVMNLVGGKEALIRIDGRRYLIEVPAQKSRGPQRQEGYHSWAGIPLQFATELFLGKIPCPSASSLEEAVFSTTTADELIVETKASLDREPERFKYIFREWDGRPWPKTLHWERRGSVSQSVNFEFDNPEDGTGSPRRWDAKSALGEVSVRWRERELAR